MLKNKNKIYKMVIFALLTALCYVATFIMIPLPTGGKIHLGNLVCILSSLLLGGVQGGLIGSLGMGLNDLHFYLDSPSTIIRTLILKFIMGFLCGSLFNLLRKKEVKANRCSILLFVLAGLFLVFGIFSLVVYLLGSIQIGSTTITFNVLVPIGLYIFANIFIIFGILFIKKEILFNYLLVSVSLATIFNIFGEFIVRSILYMLVDKYGFLASLTMSLSNIPASILTGILTSLLTIIIFPPLEKALNAKYKNI